MTSLLTVDELRARVETPLQAADIQALLDRIEAQIVDVLGNPYVDASTTITETHAGYGRDLLLNRRISTIDTVTEFDSLTDATGTELTENTHFYVWPNEGRLQRMTNAGKWGAKVTVEYVPADDRHKWKEAEIDLARLDLKRMALQTESLTTERSFTKTFTAPNWEKERRKIMERLMFTRAVF